VGFDLASGGFACRAVLHAMHQLRDSADRTELFGAHVCHRDTLLEFDFDENDKVHLGERVEQTRRQQIRVGFQLGISRRFDQELLDDLFNLHCGHDQKPLDTWMKSACQTAARRCVAVAEAHVTRRGRSIFIASFKGNSSTN